MRILFIFFVLIGVLTSCRVKNVKVFNDMGKLQERYQVLRKQQIQHGTYYLFFENGQIAIQRKFVQGKLEGEERMYYETGQLEKIAKYKNGVYTDSFKFYHENGLLEQEGIYQNDRIEGDLKTYYKSGKLKEIVHFQNGEENGAYTEYYENGKIKSEGGYLQGDHKHGLIKRYDEEGTLIQKQQCEAGECIITWQINPIQSPKDSL